MLANRVATYAPTALPIASGMPKAQSTSRVSEDQKALQADDEQDKCLHGIPLPQVAAC